MSLSILEQENVLKVYNFISMDFDVTRVYLWKSVKEFVSNIPLASSLLEIGCGNGKNNIRTDVFYIGIDLSLSMLSLKNHNHNDNICANALSIPLVSNSIDNTLCIAVLHHLDTPRKRQKAMNELVRTTCPGGRILIQVWQLHPDLIKKKGNKMIPLETSNDFLIEWPYQGKIYYRYYHLFDREEFKQLIIHTKHIKPIAIYEEHQNWVALIEKK